jgi:threonine/homoserine/homoserine lactone efflux protein
MTLAGFAAYSGALAIAAAIPGPGVTAIVARALGSGMRASFHMLLGLIAGDIVYLTAVVLGLALVAQSFGTAFLVIKWLGVAYLCYLAWSFWRAGITPQSISGRQAGGGALANFGAGLAVTLGNPKTMVFYLAITPTIMDIASVDSIDYALLVAITALVLLVVLLPYVVLAARARLVLQKPRALRLLNRAAASFMAAAAAAIAARN